MSSEATQAHGPDGAHQDISSFKRGDRVEGVYLLSKLDVRKTKHGQDFYACELSDRTGSIAARQWEIRADSFASLSSAPVVYVHALVDEWQNELQLKVDSMEPVEASMDELRFLIPHTPFQVEQLYSELRATFNSLSDPYMRAMFDVAFSDEAFVRRLKEVPAASGYHHNTLGGLLEHIVSLLRASEHMLLAYPRLNRDLVLAGAFLHDIGKVEELSWEKGFSYTTRGQLLGHIAIGTLLIDRWCRDVPNFPSSLRDELFHLVLSHHGLREHGSPVLPVTPEALVVHFLDNLDGKLWSCFKAIDDAKSGDEEWSPFSKHIGRRIYRKDRVQDSADAPTELRVDRPLELAPRLNEAPREPAAAQLPQTAAATKKPRSRAAHPELASERELEAESVLTESVLTESALAESALTESLKPEPIATDQLQSPGRVSAGDAARDSLRRRRASEPAARARSTRPADGTPGLFG
jgi:3'-5' exoribonuclease